ncbi:unnamed protein product [Prorocentrum cordatum]|uniref:Uncharacterized protein n=1 Tax=Prorocentrum cordatum TaxID=2364126 RepID=A0ABN9Q400_9DINO|nr:unnamed protein product [Polarella glacialis]
MSSPTSGTVDMRRSIDTLIREIICWTSSRTELLRKTPSTDDTYTSTLPCALATFDRHDRNSGHDPRSAICTNTPTDTDSAVESARGTISAGMSGDSAATACPRCTGWRPRPATARATAQARGWKPWPHALHAERGDNKTEERRRGRRGGEGPASSPATRT